MKSQSITYQMKTTEQYSVLVLFMMPCKVHPTFETSIHINGNSLITRSCGAVYFAIQGGSNF